MRSYPEVLGLYLERPLKSRGRCLAVFGGALRIQRLEGSRFCSRRTRWSSMGFQSTLAWKLLEGRVLVGRPSISAHLYSHDAKVPNDLIVARDASFFKTYCYLIASLESSISLASGHAEASAAKRLRSSQVLGSLLPSNAQPARSSSKPVSGELHGPLLRLADYSLKWISAAKCVQ